MVCSKKILKDRHLKVVIAIQLIGSGLFVAHAMRIAMNHPTQTADVSIRLATDSTAQLFAGVEPQQTKIGRIMLDAGLPGGGNELGRIGKGVKDGSMTREECFSMLQRLAWELEECAGLDYDVVFGFHFLFRLLVVNVVLFIAASVFLRLYGVARN